jgi:hypothetical protein
MGVSAVLRTASVTVDPGREARTQVVVRNTSAVVDQFVMTVKGDAAGWVSVRPDVINLLPSEEVVVELVFAPPRSYAVPAGEYPYALRIVSREDEAGSSVHEGVVTVAGFTGLDAQVVPKSTPGRRKGRTTLAVDNLGNYRLSVAAIGYDQDDLVTFRFRPKSVPARPGTASFLKVSVRPRKHFWKGPDRRIPYQLEVQPEAGEHLVLDAQLVQRPLLPRRTLLILPLILALLLVGAIIVATLRQQSPTSLAGLAPRTVSTTATPGRTVTGASATISRSVVGSASVTVGTGGAAVVGGGAGGTGNTGAGSASSGGFTIDATAYPGVAGTYQLFSYVVPAGTTVRVTQVHLRDAHVDQGTLQIREGDRVAVSRDLATANDVEYRFSTPLTLNGGTQVVLAVDCHNAQSACTPSAAFTTTTSD